jgi:hypothetical protein
MVDKPGPDTTGVIPKIPRTNYNAPGTTGKVALPPGEYVDMDFYGDCYPGDPTGKYRFRNPYFHGGKGHPGNNLGCLYTWNLTSGWVTIEDGTVKADDPSYYRDGIVGHRLTVKRCNVYGTNDGLGINKVDGSMSIIEQNWCHDGISWIQDPAHPDGKGTHNDPFQWQGGLIRCRGNFFSAYVTSDPRSTGPVAYPVPGRPGVGYGGSAIMISEAAGKIDPNSLIDGNWYEGGYAQVNVNNAKGAGNTLAFVMGTNRYGRDVRENYAPRTDKRWICLAPNGGKIVIQNLLTKQIWDDTGGLLTEGRASGIRTV